MQTEHGHWKSLSGLMQPVLLIPAFGLLLIVAIWAAALTQLSVDKRFVLDRAMQDTVSAAAAFEQHTLRAIKDADRSALRVKYEFEAAGKVNLQEMMSKSLMPPDEIERVSIINAAGDFTASTRDWKPLNVTDREFFQRQMAVDTGKLDISEPIISRLSRAQTIILSRRLNAGDGSFAGVVALSVHPTYFSNFYHESQLGKNGAVGVLGRGGVFHVWRVGNRSVTTPDGRATLLFSLPSVNPSGSYQSTSTIDGVDRLMAYRTLENYPLVVVAGQATDEVLAVFNRQRMTYIAVSSVASAAIVGFFGVVTLLVIRLRRSGVENTAQQGFLQTLVDNIPVGVAVRDVRLTHLGRIVLWNNTNERIQGIPRDKAMGKTAREMLSPARATRVEERDRALLARPMVQQFTDRTDDLRGGESQCLQVIRAPIFDAEGKVEYIISITSDITQEQESADQARLASKVFETTADGIMMSDVDDRVIMVNPAFSRLTGYDAGEIVGKVLAESPFRPLDLAESDARMVLLHRDGFVTGEVPRFRKDGSPLSLWVTASCVRNADGTIRNYIRVFTDISRLKSSQRDLEALADSLSEANTSLTGEIAERIRAASALHRSNQELQQINVQLQEAQGQVLQSEKLASIGQLAAGVAHEINNPIGYVLSNFGTLEGYIDDLFKMLSAYEAAEGEPASGTTATALAAMRETIELDYLKQDIPTLMKESKEGITRVRKIVEDLKDFSRTERNQVWLWANLHSGIDSTLNIVSNEIRYKADVVKEYGELPEIECLPTQLNQVFMNLLVNAAHSIDKVRGRIVIRSGTEGDQAWVEIADDGSGMSPEIKSRVFDPFFTTKPVGKGTGLGLSLAYGIIQKHNGRIDLESELGVGSTFRVWLPIRHEIDGGLEQARERRAELVVTV